MLIELIQHVKLILHACANATIMMLMMIPSFPLLSYVILTQSNAHGNVTSKTLIQDDCIDLFIVCTSIVVGCKVNLKEWHIYMYIYKYIYIYIFVFVVSPCWISTCSVSTYSNYVSRQRHSQCQFTCSLQLHETYTRIASFHRTFIRSYDFYNDFTHRVSSNI